MQDQSPHKSAGLCPGRNHVLLDRGGFQNLEFLSKAYDLLVKVLRNEWGFAGLVMSDWDAMRADRADPVKPLSGDVQKARAAQRDLVMPGRPDQVQAILSGLENGRIQVWDLKRSAVRLLRIIRSNTILYSK